MASSLLASWKWNGETGATPDDLCIPAELDVTTLLIERNADRGLGDAVAVREAGGTSVTYTQLLALVADVSRRLPWPVRSRVVLHLDTSLEYIVCFLALLRAGIVAIPVPVAASPAGLREIIGDARPAALITHLPDSYLEGASAGEGGDGGGDGLPAVVRLPVTGGIRDRLRPLLDGTPQDPPPARESRSRNDEAFWLYSSGTSGTPKGCRHRHQDIAAGAIMYAENVLDLQPGEVCVSFSPVTHSYGLAAGCYYPLWAGCELLLLGTTHFPAVWEHLVHERVNRIFGVPRHFASLLDAASAKPGTHSLKAAHSSGEQLPAGLADKLEAALGIPVLDAFGASESFTNPVSNTRGQRRPGSSGRVIPGVGHRLVSSGQVIYGPGVGELEIAAAANAFGYWNRAAATEAAFGSGYYRTGDLFERDDDGFLYFRGRMSSTFKVFGSFVEPTRVEAALRAVGEVKDALVFETRGEHEVAACGAAVVLQPGTDESGLLASLQAACARAVGMYAVPRAVYVVDALPTTHSGKIRRAGASEYVTSRGRAL